MSADPKRRLAAWIGAHAAQRVLPLVSAPPSFRLASRRVAEPERVEVPTRHGNVACLIYSPHPGAPPTRNRVDRLPVDLHLHGGAFIVRHPRHEEYIAEYITSEVGAVVVLADYATAPQIQYPVAEEQCFDVACWIRAEARTRGWDAARMSVSGASAGAKLAVNVCQQAHQSSEIRLRAAALAFPVLDLSRADRTSVKRHPRISPRIQRLAIDAYVVDPRVRCQPLASPVYDADLADAMPPTLIITGELDTLGPEGDLLAHNLAGRGVAVTHHRLPSIDHGFTRSQAASAHAAMRMIGAHLIENLT
ncbi:alpha/beta hydrolase fold domain-containing protein [Mycolicibacterium sp. 120270]|uniref:alpha/beta hydrolase fold domain-containing protein n=1 Tax=Mycolicibacterium sp. 120270 TaxID=3090600 RepID=UPI00299DAB2D|nr:alpha/beta hydrolase fold domain-containing protein [Mycolicibacterium sp. 120270]MDX1882202.1 alpha/beta hydrolase fold domain-containing protein [Mycolicibacterium sp. 120270]